MIDKCSSMISQFDQFYLVRFGGAGACLPRLFVVRLICTLAFPLVENVLNFDVVEQSKNQYHV